MPNIALQVAAILLRDRMRLKTLDLVHRALDFALPLGQYDVRDVNHRFPFYDETIGQVEVDTLLVLPPIDLLRDLNRVNRIGSVVFDEDLWTRNGQGQLDHPGDLELDDEQQVFEIHIIGRRKTQPLVKITGRSQDRHLTIDFRGATGFVDA